VVTRCLEEDQCMTTEIGCVGLYNIRNSKRLNIDPVYERMALEQVSTFTDTFFCLFGFLLLFYLGGGGAQAIAVTLLYLR
jgi:hypothetical protein